MTIKSVREIRVQGNLAFVPLTKGHEATLDAADISKIGDGGWWALESKRADGTIRTVYAVRFEGSKNDRKMVYMHRAISGAMTGEDVDHKDCDGTNNRRENLRKVSRSQNSHNTRRRVDNTSGHKGVSWDERSQRWHAYINKNGKRRHLGYFGSISDAATAYAAASAAMHGEFGRTG